MKARIGTFISSGENARDEFYKELRRSQAGEHNSHIELHRARTIERWREDMQACFEAQKVLRMPDARDYVMTSSGDRISPSIERLRDVLREWPKWKA